MKFGLIGLGAMGSNHARVLTSLNVLNYVFDVDFEKAKIVADKYNAYPCSSLEELFSFNPDGLNVAVPTKFQLAVVSECLNRKIPTLAEKPISSNIVDGEALVNLAESNKTLFAVGYIERFNPAYQALLNLVRTGYFGEVTSVNIKRVGGEPRSAKNVILDLMTHDLDLLATIFNKEPSKVFTHTHSSSGIINSAQTLLDFEEASATCEANWISPVKIREIHVTGTKGCVIVDMIRQELTQLSSLSKNSKSLNVHNFNSEPLKEEIQAFIADISDGKLTRSVSGREALRALKITLKAMESVNGN